MRRYRETPLGKAMVQYQNAKVQRPDREYECYVCKGKFMSARKRNTCYKCIEEMIEDGYKNPELSVSVRIWKSANPERVADSKTSAVSRRLSGRDGKPPTLQASCLVCDNTKVEQHHHNYSKM